MFNPNFAVAKLQAVDATCIAFWSRLTLKKPFLGFLRPSGQVLQPMAKSGPNQLTPYLQIFFSFKECLFTKENRVDSQFFKF
jgi:hypothetical protein